MRSSLCAIIISMVMSASALAQGLPSGISPSMIETLKRMPAEQQKALAEQYGIDLPPDEVGVVTYYKTAKEAIKKAIEEAGMNPENVLIITKDIS